MFKRRLKLRKMPHPLRDAFLADFLSGAGVGAFVTLAVIVLVFKSA